MRFRNLLEKYRNRTATEQERQKVEEELEKFEAINDFLYERLEESAEAAEPDLSDAGQDLQAPEAGPEEFTKVIRKEMRRIFVKLGVCVGCIVIGVVLFIMLALPAIVSCFYYDPGKIIARSGEGNGVEEETNQMSLDLEVYTELMLPECRRDQVEAEDRGYGKYDIYIVNNVYWNGEGPQDVAGKIERGRLTLYNPNVLRRMASNQFGWTWRDSTEEALTQQDRSEEKEWQADPGYEENTERTHGTIDRQDVSDLLQELAEDQDYYAYITLNRMMDYDAFLQFYDAQQGLRSGWCAVKTETPEDGMEFRPSNLGFVFDPSSSSIVNWDDEKYPDLVLSTLEKENMLREEARAAQHFISMLNYMADQPDFCEMMELDQSGYQCESQQEGERSFRSMARYVEENGLQIYGFVVRADKAALLKLFQQQQVYSIDVAR